MAEKEFKYARLTFEEMEIVETEWIKRGGKGSLTKFWEDNMETLFKVIFKALKRRIKSGVNKYGTKN